MAHKSPRTLVDAAGRRLASETWWLMGSVVLLMLAECKEQLWGGGGVGGAGQMESESSF